MEGLLKKRWTVFLNDTSPMLRHQIFRKGTLVFERDRLASAALENFLPATAAKK